MDTIAINANESLNENRQERKKFKVSDTVKAAMAAGVAGAAAGVAGMSMAKEIIGEADEVQASVSENQHVQQENVVAETEIMDSEAVEVNPEYVMLEEPVVEPSTETDMIAEAQPQHNEDEEYQPFANNDRISDDFLPEPQPDEILFAEDANTDAVVEEAPVADLICSVTEEEPVITEETVYLDDDLYADNGSTYVDSDIQSDLMA